MQSSTSFPPEYYVEQAQSSSQPQGGPKPSPLPSSLGALNGFPDDGPHTITAVPHMGGQSNNNQGQGTYTCTIILIIHLFLFFLTQRAHVLYATLPDG